MKILKIIHTTGHGGAENVFRWLAYALRKRGAEVVAGVPLRNNATRGEHWLIPALEELGVPYETFDRSGSARCFYANIRALIEKVRPDLVHAHLLDSNFYSALACLRLSIPHLSTEHGDVQMTRSVSVRAKFRALSVTSQAIVCVSEAIRRHAIRYALLPGRLRVIPNGMQYEPCGRSAFREEFGIPAGAVVIGNVGNLYPVKGQRYLVEAFGRFIKSRPDSYLVLVGRGGEEDALRRLVAACGVDPGRVIFTGFRKDVVNIIGSLDLFVQSSLSEGLPIALLEAMARDLPVLATDVGGVREVLEPAGAGTLVPPGSTGALFDGLIAIVSRLSDHKERAKRAGEHVRQEYSLDRMADRYLALYRDLVRFDAVPASVGAGRI